jgi:hypothetical protein
MFAGASVFRLIKDDDYDAVDDPVDRGKLQDLFFSLGIPVYLCRSCGRLAVEWDQASGPRFYAPEERSVEHLPAEEINLHFDQVDGQRLRDLEAMAEAEYQSMYDSQSPAADYARAKDAFCEAISLANTLGLQDDVTRLEKRLQHLKDVFRNQF